MPTLNSAVDVSGTGRTQGTIICLSFTGENAVGVPPCRNIEHTLSGRMATFVERVELVCADDEAAKEQAKSLADGHDVELWQKARRIAEFRSNH